MVEHSQIRVVAGGKLNPAHVWDREVLIAQVWRTLESQSVYFTGERRMGKTSILDKMRAYPLDGAVLVYIDVEELQRPGEFAADVYEKVTASLPALARTRGLLARGLKSRFGVSKFGVGPVSVEFREMAEARWPEVLDELVAALGRREDDPQVVLCFDKLPQFLSNIVAAGYPLEARRVLDKLRELRQSNVHVRMIYTGSIGLHHVETKLRELGSSWAPTNDMKKIDVPPFAEADAVGLAEVLLVNEGVQCDPVEGDVALAIASITDGVPYYIHLIVDALRSHAGPAKASSVREVVTAAINDPDDAWGFRHFVNRVPEYYANNADLAYAVLDIVSQNIGTFDELMAKLPARADVDSRSGNQVRAIVELLERDHYLTAEGGTLRFRRALLERAWRAKRYLS
jgi:hypothetical protein